MAKELQEVGEVLHLTKSSRLIVRLVKEAYSGEMLVDKNGKRVGKVVEIIGPVSSPYASVLPARSEKVIGIKVFRDKSRESTKLKKRHDII